MSAYCIPLSSELASSGDVLPEILLEMNTAALVETLFYGIHFVLFCICMFILVRNRRPTQWFILASAFVMFALSTADISTTFRLMTHEIIPAATGRLDPVGLDQVLKLLYEKCIIFVSNNLIAELILSYRCYMIWGRSKYLLGLTSLLVLGDTIWGYLSLVRVRCFLVLWAFSVPTYIWSVFAINVVISGITIGRIFWVSHIARPILGHRNLRHFRFIIAILLESSAVYSACLLFVLVIRDFGVHWHISILNPGSKSTSLLVVGVIGIRIVAIMPTLLIVQVGLLADHIAGDANDCERPGTSSVVLDTIITTNYESHDAPGVMGTQTRDTLDDINSPGPREPGPQSFTPIFRPRTRESLRGIT